MITLPILTTSLTHFSFRRLGECTFDLGRERLKHQGVLTCRRCRCPPAAACRAPPLPTSRALCHSRRTKTHLLPWKANQRTIMQTEKLKLHTRTPHRSSCSEWPTAELEETTCGFRAQLAVFLENLWRCPQVVLWACVCLAADLTESNMSVLPLSSFTNRVSAFAS